MGHLVYLTGVPGSGKSTIAKQFAQTAKNCTTVDYGSILLDFLRQHYPTLSYEDMRKLSSDLITSEDVRSIEDLLKKKITELRKVSDVILDTHPILKEDFGFKGTMFTPSEVQKLGINAVVVVFASYDTILERIGGKKRMGRKQFTEQDLQIHFTLQSSAALQYSILSGCPFYALDNNRNLDVSVSSMERILAEIRK